MTDGRGTPHGRSASGVDLVPITDEDLKAVCKLELGPGQERFVADNVWSLAEAYVNGDQAWPRASASDGQLVGFLMLEIDPEEEQGRHLWLWRLMTGAAHQGRGVGSAAVALAADEVRSRGDTSL